ncbi:unnamed protein product [Calypogeia fissa]
MEADRLLCESAYLPDSILRLFPFAISPIIICAARKKRSSSEIEEAHAVSSPRRLHILFEPAPALMCATFTVETIGQSWLMIHRAITHSLCPESAPGRGIDFQTWASDSSRDSDLRAGQGRATLIGADLKEGAKWLSLEPRNGRKISKIPGGGDRWHLSRARHRI